MNGRVLIRPIVFGLMLALGHPSFGDLSTGLQGYWQFDGNGNDSSGNGNTLTVAGNPSYGTGLFGQALSLDNNSSQYANLSSNPTAFNLGSSDFTMQVWVNFNSGINGREQTLLEKCTGEGAPGWSLTTPGGDTIRFVADGVGDTNSPTMTFTTGVWNQIIVERRGSEFYMYYNDVEVASMASSAAITSSTNPLLFGKRDDQDGRDFALNGSLDEVAIWNRALSTSEVSELYNGGQGLVIPASVPEPASLAMMAIGLVGAAVVYRRTILPHEARRH